MPPPPRQHKPGPSAGQDPRSCPGTDAWGLGVRPVLTPSCLCGGGISPSRGPHGLTTRKAQSRVLLLGSSGLSGGEMKGEARRLAGGVIEPGSRRGRMLGATAGMSVSVPPRPQQPCAPAPHNAAAQPHGSPAAQQGLAVLTLPSLLWDRGAAAQCPSSPPLWVPELEQDRPCPAFCWNAQPQGSSGAAGLGSSPRPSICPCQI